MTDTLDWVLKPDLDPVTAYARYAGIPSESLTRIPSRHAFVVLVRTEDTKPHGEAVAMYYPTVHSSPDFEKLWHGTASYREFRAGALSEMRSNAKWVLPRTDLMSLANAYGWHADDRIRWGGHLPTPSHWVTDALVERWKDIEIEAGASPDAIALMLGLGLDDTTRQVLADVEALGRVTGPHAENTHGKNASGNTAQIV